MTAEILYLHFEHRFGRAIASGSLSVDGTVEHSGPLSHLLTIVQENDYELVNAQEILDVLVRVNGFAA